MPHLVNSTGDRFINLDVSTADQFIQKHPEPTEPVIDGVIRRGEVGNLIGSTKQGKSWLMLGMCLSIAAGRDWMGRKVLEGQVAIVDNELQPGTLADRVKTVAEQMKIPQEKLSRVAILSRRIQQTGVLEAGMDIDDAFEYELIDDKPVLVALDCYYRFQNGKSELDIAATTETYNQAIYIANSLNAAVIFNHHSTKGSQAEKSVTDMGSGTGAISRAVDTHIVFREHRLENCAVMESATRSFKTPEPLTIRWEYPLWIAKPNIEPEVKNAEAIKAERRAQADAKADDCVMAALDDGRPRTIGRILESKHVEFGRTKVQNCLNRCVKSGRVKKRSRNGKTLYKKNEK